MIEKNFEGEVVFKLDKIFNGEINKGKDSLKSIISVADEVLVREVLKNTVISKKNILFGNIVSEAWLKIGMKEKMNTLLLLGKDSVVVIEAVLKIWINRIDEHTH